MWFVVYICDVRVLVHVTFFAYVDFWLEFGWVVIVEVPNGCRWALLLVFVGCGSIWT